MKIDRDYEREAAKREFDYFQAKDEHGRGLKYVIGLSEGRQGVATVMREDDPRVNPNGNWKTRYDTEDEAQAHVDEMNANARLCWEMGYGRGRYMGD